MSKKRKKKYSNLRHARQKVIGLIVSWIDESPLMDSSGFIPGEVSHANPLLRLMAKELYGRHKDWIVSEATFFWKVSMTLIFNFPDANGNKQLFHVPREFYAQCRLTEMADACESEFIAAMRYGTPEAYTHTEFVVECLGNNPTTIDEEEAA